MRKPDTLPRDLHRTLLLRRLRAALERWELIGIGEYTDALQWLDGCEADAERLEGVGV